MSWKTNKNGKMSRIQRCSNCGKKLEPICQIGSDPENWNWTECDYCFEPICRDCAEINTELRGLWICVTCLQDPKLRTKHTNGIL